MWQKKNFRSVVAVFCLTVFLASGQPVYAGEIVDTTRIDKKINLLEDYIEDYYLFDSDSAQIEESIYAGVLAGLGDVYSEYYTKEKYAQMIEELSGNYCGIGVAVQQNLITGVITFDEVYENGPAGQEGLLAGDILTAVNGISTSEKYIEDIVNYEIKGAAGTTIHITVYRPSTDETLTKELQRAAVEAVTASGKMLESHVGYIKISAFDELTAAQFEKAVTQLEGQGMERLIIDLRNNGGGLLDSAVEMLAYILPAGKLVYTKDKNGEGELYQTKDQYLMISDYPEKKPGINRLWQPDEHELRLPMVVLVNGQSASASELFAGALQDYQWAVIMGEQTFGKGIVQKVFPLDDGSAVKLTTSYYYTPNGNNIHLKGITPDVKIELDKADGKDNQLQKAIEVVKKR